MDIQITNNTDKPAVFPAGFVGIMPDGNIKASPMLFPSDILNLLNPDLPAKEVIFYKGASIGMSGGIIPGALEYFVNPEIKEL